MSNLQGRDFGQRRAIERLVRKITLGSHGAGNLRRILIEVQCISLQVGTVMRSVEYADT